MDDGALLRAYAEQGAEAAFTALVRRHLDFVYGCALRRVGHDAHLAEDVSQQVFRALAGDAAALAGREGLSGWLFVTTRNVAAQLVRGERRRHARESEASIMNENPPDPDWEKLRPVIDEALDGLSDDDRAAVLMRFYEGRPFAEVGGRLRLAENAARMRVERALDKMRVILGRHGVTSTSAALGIALANHAVAAPPGLAGIVTGAALTRGAGAGGFTTTSKLILGAAAAVAVVAIGVTMQQARAMRIADAETATAARRTTALRAELRTREGRLATAEQRAEAADADAKRLLKAIQEAAPAIALPPGDARCLAFVVDTSGSMRNPKTNALWSAVFYAMAEEIAAHRDVDHLMAFDANGRIIFSGNQEWLAPTPENLQRIETILAGYDEDTQSSPVPGIYRAMRVLPPAGGKARLQVCVIGDELNSADQTELVLRRLDELNPADARGRRAASISAIQLPTTVRYAGTGGMGNTGVRFQALMTEVAKQHGGTFKLLPENSLR